MQRFTISLDDDLAREFDELVKRRGYSNRSEAFRDMLRAELAQENLNKDEGSCVAVVSYSYNHEARTLSTRMVDHQHSHLGLVIATLHVHISKQECVEAVVMRGNAQDIKKLASQTIAETGVQNGAAHFIPLEAKQGDSQADPHEAVLDDHRHGQG